jgi:phage portal protein BeeE
MGILSRGLRFFRDPEHRAISFQDAFSQGLPFGRTATASGRSVTIDSAEQLSAVHACTSFISDAIAQLPVGVFTEDASGDKIKVPTPGWITTPNPEQTTFEFFEAQALSLLYRGNFYASVIADAMGNVLEVWPLDPDSVTPERGPNRETR